MLKKILNYIKKKWIRLLIILGLLGMATAAVLNNGVPIEIPSLTIDGELIEFVYTDDNTDEDLIIHTNQEEYPNYFGSITVYYSILNNSKKNQYVKTVFSFSDESGNRKNVRTVAEYDGEEIIETELPAHFETVLIPSENGTSTYGQLLIEATTTTEIHTKWKEHSEEVFDKTLLESVNAKSIKKAHRLKAHKRKKDGFYLKKGERKFFKAIIDYLPDQEREEFFLETFGSKKAYGHLDPFIFEDLFNSDTKTLGVLAGQDGWGGNTDWVVQNTTKFEGDQGVQIAADGKSVTSPVGIGCTSGVVFIAIRVHTAGSSNNEAMAWFKDDGGAIGFIASARNDATDGLILKVGAAKLTDMSVDTWYLVAVEWAKDHGGSGDHEYRYKWKVSGGLYSAWSGWVDDHGATDGTIDHIWLYVEAGWDAFFDTITPTDPEPDAPPPAAEEVVPAIIKFE